MIGLDIDTRQSAAAVTVCLLAFVIFLGRRRARRFLVATVGAIILVGGPWLGYATYKWGTLQSTLYRPGGMIKGGEPTSFYVSFPASLWLTPTAPTTLIIFPNQALPRSSTPISLLGATGTASSTSTSGTPRRG